ncbi:8038_t:CDS:2 [Cetraspora pellucida]|uniref:8038_t:CDS:1 n=1 Tax=Cetraspora pellucida TaxID=1433469 RepID=A0ACA9K2L2_9GLOM|nr:8038_t:CDS:2 [Cetraspora pellucida]
MIFTAWIRAYNDFRRYADPNDTENDRFIAIKTARKSKSRNAVNKKSAKFPSSSTAVSPASDVCSDETIQAPSLLTSRSGSYEKSTKTPISTAVSPASDICPDKTVQTLRQPTALNANYKAVTRFQSYSTAVSPTSMYADVSISAPIDACHDKTNSNIGPITPISMKPISTFSAHYTANKYNPDKFNCKPSNARFFVMKSYFEDDVHTSIKYGIWRSTEIGNSRLDKAFRDNADKGPIYLFFSVNARNNENKPVTNSRDTQELYPEAGHEMLKKFFYYRNKTSILDDFKFYEKRQIEMEKGGIAPESSEIMPYETSLDVVGKPVDCVNNKAVDGVDSRTVDCAVDNSVDSTVDNSVDSTVDNSVDSTVDNSVDSTVDNSITNVSTLVRAVYVVYGTVYDEQYVTK